MHRRLDASIHIRFGLWLLSPGQSIASGARQLCIFYYRFLRKMNMLSLIGIDSQITAIDFDFQTEHISRAPGVPEQN